MSDRITEILVREAVDTLEKLVFFFAEPEEDPSTFADTDVFTVATEFSGPYSGRLVMEYAAEGLAELAANMLGIDEEDEITEEDQRDALKETLNIICGNVLPAIAGSEAVFNIAAPELSQGPYSGDAAAAYAVARLTMDEGFLSLFLFFEGESPD